LGSGMEWVFALAIDGNRNLYVGGGFLRAGDKVSPYLAKYLTPDEKVFLPDDAQPDEITYENVDADTTMPNSDGCGCSVVF